MFDFLPGNIASLFVAGALASISQADRPILLILLTYGMPTWMHWVVPRPEDMSYTYPTRATAINTLGGAYVDDFGSAIAEINLRGNTGYKMGGGNAKKLGGVSSGDISMFNLRNMLVQNYHELRLAAAKAGQDPAEIQLLLVDTLNMTSWLTYPRQFQLQRSKQSPLLYRYNLQLWGLERLI